MSFWDWKSGHRFQALDTTAQPGSLDAEAGIMSSVFDRTGSRLICGETDKTSKHCTTTSPQLVADYPPVKIWKQDEKATPETHPLKWEPAQRSRRF